VTPSAQFQNKHKTQLRRTGSGQISETGTDILLYSFLKFWPNIYRNTLKANLVDVGAQNVMMLEMAGLGWKDGRLSTLVAHTHQFHITREVDWDTVEMLGVDEERFKGWRVAVALTGDVPLTETSAHISAKVA